MYSVFIIFCRKQKYSYVSKTLKTLRSTNNIMANNSTTVPRNILILSIVFKLVAMIIGVLGNVTVIIHTIFTSKEKTATSYLVGNLALADLLVCLTFYPIWIFEFMQTILNIDTDQNLFCNSSRSSIHALLFASVATLLAITVDRHL